MVHKIVISRIAHYFRIRLKKPADVEEDTLIYVVFLLILLWYYFSTCIECMLSNFLGKSP
jgi:hypothetical protein